MIWPDEKKMFECFTKQIDDGIWYYMRMFNASGFKTVASCSNFWRDHTNVKDWNKYMGAYVTFQRNDKLTEDLMFKITKTIWQVSLDYLEDFGECIRLGLPYSYHGEYVEERKTSEAWELLLEILGIEI